MPISNASSVQKRPESKALVVAISALQLALVALVWLLALVPVALLALGGLAFQALRSAAKRRRLPLQARLDPADHPAGLEVDMGLARQLRGQAAFDQS